MRGSKRSFVVEVRRVLGRASTAKTGSSFFISDKMIDHPEPTSPLHRADLWLAKEEQSPAPLKTGRILPALDQSVTSVETLQSIKVKKRSKTVSESSVTRPEVSVETHSNDAAERRVQNQNLKNEKASDSVSMPYPSLLPRKSKRRYSKILARYVFGTLPRRGERWKLRLRFI